MWMLMAVQKWDKTSVEQNGIKKPLTPPYPFYSYGYLPVFEDYPTALKASDYHSERLVELEPVRDPK